MSNSHLRDVTPESADSRRTPLSLHFVRLTTSPRERRRRPLLWAAAVLAIFGTITTVYGFARGQGIQEIGAATMSACEFALAPAETSGTILSLTGEQMAVDTGGCRLDISLAPNSMVAAGIDAGSVAVVRHAPGILRGSRVLISAQPPAAAALRK